MSPQPAKPLTPGQGFPRVSGDEPFEGHVNLLAVEFSPRERG